MLDRLTIDHAKLERDKERVARGILSAAVAAVGEETKGLERDLERITQLAVRGKLWRAWRSEVYPKRGPARNPAGKVFVNGGKRSQGAITFFTREGRITAGGGQYLAIPTDAAGPRGRARDLSPGEFERRTGTRLRFVYRRHGASMLVLDDAVLSGKTQTARKNTARRIASGRGSMTIVVFFLIPYAAYQPRFAVEPLVARRQMMLPDNFERRAKALPDVK